MLDKIKFGAGRIAKNISISSHQFSPRGRFPAIDRGTEGHAVLFKEILRSSSI